MSSIPYHDSKMFTWTKGYIGIADASDFGTKPIYSGGMFKIRSSRTGAIQLFFFHKCERDLEGEVVCEKFYSTDGYEAIIYND